MSNIKDFQTLRSIVDNKTISLLCDEMDTVLKEQSPQQGRRPGTDRYLVKKNITPQYTSVNNWAESILNNHFNSTGYCIGFLSYVRQKESNALHVDANPNQSLRYTVLLPLRDISATDCTVVFDYSTQQDDSTKKVSSQQALLQAEQECRRNQNKEHDNYAVKYNLTHVPDWVNKLPLAGVFRYRLGDAVLFNGHLLHCSNDWKKIDPERSHKDYVLMHISEASSKTFQETAY